ncbi:MAG: enoyl-CoA hydratase/isomerase family protein [Rhodobacteraceae bacterium]|nr:enoyl-CoA hydratase/isomerase family protein [Paracoccaceae bacterium]
MSEIDIRIEGRAGRITFRRPGALNALTYDMLRRIEAALDGWAGDNAVEMVIFDAEGDKAFCAGGDIADLYAAGRAGDFAFGRRFWRDEYRLNAKLAEYAKPTVSFMQGFTMGGGVGIGCHCSHRIVGHGSKIAMPECGIGLIPDVGGSMILATAPGRMGEYLGMTATRMGPGDAILAGFADHFVPETGWGDLAAKLTESADAAVIETTAEAPPPGTLEQRQGDIDDFFSRGQLGDILVALDATETDFAAKAREALLRNSPLSMACTLELVARVRANPTIRSALAQEYRFTWRASDKGDFLEGIRAAIIDKDRNPRWQHGPTAVTAETVAEMMAPLGDNDMSWE